MATREVKHLVPFILCSMTCTAACGDGGKPAEGMPSATDTVLTPPGMPSETTADPTAPVSPTIPVAPDATSPVTNASAGMGGMGGVDGSAGVGGTAAGGTPGAGGTGMTCDIASLSLFSRSDTEATWDDNDFSDVVMEGSCPLLVNVTWPHEAGWENAGPAEANHEQTHFTLDSYHSSDLTGKQLNLTIELSEDLLGPAATAAGYVVSLVSVSSFERVVGVAEDAADAGADGRDAGTVLDAGDGADAGTLGSVDASSDAGPDAPVTSTETGYAETELPMAERVVLRHVGDRATVTFALPDAGDIEEYDPSKVIKINVRIYNLFSGPEAPVEDPEGGIGWDGGAGPDGGLFSDGGSERDGGDTALASEPGPSDAGTPVGAPGPVYDYISATFAITNFTVTDAGFR